MSSRAPAHLSQPVRALPGPAPLTRHLLAAGILLAGSHALAQSTVQTLPEVKVQAQSDYGWQQPHAGGQVARGGSLGLLGTQDAMNVPFSTMNYTSEVMRNQQSRTLADVVVNDASVRMSTGSTGFDDTFQIRGFAVSATDVGLNGLYGLASQNRIPVQIIERAEVLKGPGALINGIAPSGSIGGGINVVTKRAGATPLTRVSGIYQSQSNFGLGLDLGRRFGANKEWGVRFNGQVRTGEATIDNSNQRGGVGALGIDYQGRRLRWSLDAIQQRDSTDNFRPQISILSTTTAIPAAPNARTNFYPGTALVQRDSTILTQAEYDFNDSLTGYAGIGYRDGINNQTFPGTVAGGGVNALGNFTIRNSYYDSYTKTTSGNAGLRWRFDTAGIGHTVVAGVTSMAQEAGNAYVQSPAPGVVSNIYNPVALPAVVAPRNDPRKASETSLKSYAIADTLSFGQGRVLLTLGARHQTVDVDSWNTTTGAFTSNYNSSAVSPLAGIVFKPVANVSVYGNYTTGLTRGAIVGAGYANTGATLSPYKSKQYEAGVKVDWKGLTTIASVYQLSRPAAQADAANNYGYFGEQRNRGLELSAYGELRRGLRGMGSIAFVDAELTSTSGGVNQGNQAAGVPRTTASLGMDWDTPWVPGLSLNGRAVYTSGSYLTAANTLSFDPWTRYDIGARYTTAVNGKQTVLRANIENLLNKNYWLTTGTYATVAAPRTVIVSATVDF